MKTPRRFIISRMFPTASWHDEERYAANPVENGTLTFNKDRPENTEFIEVEEILKSPHGQKNEDKPK